MKMFILSVATSVIVVVIAFFVGPYGTMGNLKAQLATLEQEVMALQDYSVELADAAEDSFNSIELQITSTLTSLNSSIAALESSLEDQETQSSTDIATLKSSITALTNSLTSLADEVDSFDNDALTSALSALESRVEDLEDTVEDLEGAVEDLEDEIADYDYISAVIISTNGLSIDDGDDAFAGTLVVRVANGTGDDVYNVILMLSFEADDDIPDVSSATLSGGSQTWYYYGQNGNILYFYNTTNTIDLEDGSYWQKTLTLTVYFDDNVTEDIDFDADVAITSYY